MIQKSKSVAIFSMEHGLMEVKELTVLLWKQVKQGVYTYLAKIGLSDCIAWRSEDCPDITLPAGCAAEFILMVA